MGCIVGDGLSAAIVVHPPRIGVMRKVAALADSGRVTKVVAHLADSTERAGGTLGTLNNRSVATFGGAQTHARVRAFVDHLIWDGPKGWDGEDGGKIGDRVGRGQVTLD